MIITPVIAKRIEFYEDLIELAGAAQKVSRQFFSVQPLWTCTENPN
jgi:hypothetical protein